jgi:hypothetical protein
VSERVETLAFHSRGENKDAYDLAYVLQNYDGRAEAIARRLAPLQAAKEASQALKELERDFATIDSLGPLRVSEFIYGSRNDAAEADAWGAVRDFLDKLFDTKMP